DGRLDTYNTQEFDAVIHPYLTDKSTNILINCENLSYISSSGIRSLILLQKSVAKNHGRMALEAMKPEVHKIFEMTGCASLFTIR
ncbi:MAG: STAS domain-containing protein, partial [Rikenellaceae bacterium]